MAGSRITLFFFGQNRGWSEIYYHSANIGALGTAISNLFGVRTRGLSFGYAPLAARASDPDNPGTSTFYEARQVPPPGPVGQELLPDVPTSAIYFRFFDSTFLYKKPFILRGCPDDWILRTREGSWGLSPDARNWVRDFVGYLRNDKGAQAGGPFALRVADHSLPNTDLGRIVSAAALDAQGRLTVTVPGHTYLPNQTIRLNRMGAAGNMRLANGVRRVVGAAANVYTLNFVNPKVDPAKYLGSGTSYLRAFKYVDMTGGSSLIRDTTSRQTGKASFQHRGKSGVKH